MNEVYFPQDETQCKSFFLEVDKKRLNIRPRPMSNPTMTTQPTSPQEANQFAAFPKMARLSREAIITEKIDGTNAQVFITDDGDMFTGSRTRWITPEEDNFGFARWAQDHKDELLTLGPGRHFGEWWGKGIQRNYGLEARIFSLFNVIRWCLHGESPQRIPSADPRIEKYQSVLPPCCSLVPILYRGNFTTQACEDALDLLRTEGSIASPGFKKPEGIVCFHVAGNVGFKKTLDKDGIPKGLQDERIARTGI
jgi:hypothetical protein